MSEGNESNHNRVFEVAKTGRIFMYVLFLLLFSLILVGVLQVNETYSGFVFTVTLVLCIYVMPVLWFSRWLQKTGLSLKNLFRGRVHLKGTEIVFSTFMPMIFQLGVLLLCFSVFYSFIPESSTSEGAGSPAPLWVFIVEIFVLVIVGPIFEEIVFRGYLLGRLSYKFGMKYGIILSSFLFGVLHVQNVFGATMAGVILSIFYIRSGSLISPIIIHICFNLMVGIRDIYYRYFLASEGAASLPSISILLVGGAVLTGLSLCWIIPFLKKHWGEVVEQGYPDLRA